MAEPFLGEIRLMSFGYAPQGWALCNGQILPINTNQALFSLLGTTYGGNGTTTFALPDLRGRVPLKFGQGHTLGERAGEEAHTLSISEMPTHVHALMASPQIGNQPVPGGTDGTFPAAPLAVLASTAPNLTYGPANGLVPLNSSSVTNVGGSQAHLNMQPFLTLSFCIALVGIFPSPT